MKYFLDSAKLDEIKYAYENYGIDGVTTNPKHIRMSGKPFMTCVKDIAQWLKESGLEGKDFPVSFEINPHLDKAEEIVKAAKEVASYSKNYCIKIPCLKKSDCCQTVRKRRSKNKCNFGIFAFTGNSGSKTGS